MVPFAGYEMPVQYQGVLDETRATRAAAGLFDVSHMGQVVVRGSAALDGLQRLVTGDLSKIAVGQAQYNMLCDERGGVIDDLVVYRREPDEFYLCVNASNRDADVAWLRAGLPRGVELVDESDDTALLALQGPRAEELLAPLVSGTDLKALRYYWGARAELLGAPAFISRTGYTGEDGFEIYLPASAALGIWDGLLERGRALGVVPVGLGARDTLRLEMGFPLHGHEISREISPLEAGLGWVVKLAKTTAFTGQSMLAAQAKEGPRRALRGLVTDDRRIPRQGYSVVDASGTTVGQITSGTFSPHTQTPIALALLNRTAPTDGLAVTVRDARVPVSVVKPPFVPSRVRK